MRPNRWVYIPVFVSLLFGAPGIAQAQSETTLAEFSASTAGPVFIMQAGDGNFYGAAGAETLTSTGVIFKLTPDGTLTTLFSANNFTPVSFFQGGDGNFYGAADYSGQFGVGLIFKMTLQGAITALYSFAGPDGANPNNLILGADGNFYGTTAQGGTTYKPGVSSGHGTFFKLTPTGTLTSLHSFTGPDGAQPVAGMVLATDGNFYGVTEYGGAGSCQNGFEPAGCGSIFKITPEGAFSTFASLEGQTRLPAGGLIQASDGNLYGTTYYGGDGACVTSGFPGCGTVYKLTLAGVLTTLYNLDATDGAYPENTLIQASDGNLYGTVASGGSGACQSPPSPSGCGGVIKVTLAGVGTNVYSAPPETGTQGRFAAAPGVLIQAVNGDLYGTSEVGGDSGNGIIFGLSLGLPAIVVPPAIVSSGGVLNGASFQPGISPGAWITINGTNLASSPATWNSAIVNGALPTKLGGVSVSVGGLPAYVEYVSAGQINAIAPNVPSGPAQVIVTNSNGSSQAVNTQVSAATPAFFQWGNYAVATHQDYSLAVKDGTFTGTTTVPAAPGDVIILWGTGFGATSPAAPAGMETPSSATYNTASAVSVTIGTTAATVYGAALAPGYAGLYQIAIQIPAGLANGDYPVVATIAGAASPMTTLITIQQ